VTQLGFKYGFLMRSLSQGDNAEKFLAFSSTAERNYNLSLLILKWVLPWVLLVFTAVIAVDRRFSRFALQCSVILIGDNSLFYCGLARLADGFRTPLGV